MEVMRVTIFIIVSSLGSSLQSSSSPDCQQKLLCSLSLQSRNVTEDITSDQSCENQFPKCSYSEESLMLSYNSLLDGSLLRSLVTSKGRSKRSIAGLPPLITTSGTNPACQTCEMFGTVCFVFSIGSFGACTGASLTGVDPSGYCNILATPGRVGCSVSSVICYKRGCGLIRLPRLPFKKK